MKELLKTLEGHDHIIIALCPVGPGQLASGSRDKNIKIWDIATGQCLKTLEGHTEAVIALCLLSEGKLVSGSSDGKIKIWDIDTGQCLKTLQGHAEGIIVLCPLDPGQLASASSDGKIKIWDIATGQCIKTLEDQAGSITALCQVSEGKLVSGSSDGKIKIWDIATGQCIKTLEDQAGSITALCPLSEGELASGSSGGKIKIWDIVTGQCLKALEGHAKGVMTLCQVNEGQLTSGSRDESIKIWDIATGQFLQTIKYSACVNVLCQVGPGKLASSAYLGIEIWDISTVPESPLRKSDKSSWWVKLAEKGPFPKIFQPTLDEKASKLEQLIQASSVNSALPDKQELPKSEEGYRIPQRKTAQVFQKQMHSSSRRVKNREAEYELTPLKALASSSAPCESLDDGFSFGDSDDDWAPVRQRPPESLQSLIKDKKEQQAEKIAEEASKQDLKQLQEQLKALQEERASEKEILERMRLEEIKSLQKMYEEKCRKYEKQLNALAENKSEVVSSSEGQVNAQLQQNQLDLKGLEVDRNIGHLNQSEGENAAQLGLVAEKRVAEEARMKKLKELQEIQMRLENGHSVSVRERAMFFEVRKAENEAITPNPWYKLNKN